MACRGCVNLQCNCFTKNSSTTTTVGNGSPYAPFTFRPNYTPFPRPFGDLYALNPQLGLDGAPFTNFELVTPDIDQGGNMRTGNATSLTARVDGIYLVGITVPSDTVATDNLNDNFSIRKNGGTQVGTVTFAHNSTTSAGLFMVHSVTTLLDLNTGDTLDLYVERVAGAGTVPLTTSPGVALRLWAIWMGGPI